MSVKIYSFPKTVFEYYNNKLKEWINSILPTKTSELTNDSDFLNQLSLAGIIASTFSENSTYAVNDYVLYNHTLYRCSIAVTVAGPWDSSKWTATNTQYIFSGSSAGLVPSPAVADRTNGSFLSGNGTWNAMQSVPNSDIDEIFSIVVIGGTSYSIAKIGNQLWMTENLDYKFQYEGGTLPVGGTGLPSTPNAWYYQNNEADYGINGTYKCGLIYNWFAAKYLEDNKSTLLPDGWHLPTESDWNTLATSVGGISTAGTKLKAKDNTITSNWPSSWNGTNNYNFNAIPSGYYDANFNALGGYAGFWTSDVMSDFNAKAIYLDTGASMSSNYSRYKGYGLSIRLVKNIT